MRHNDEGPPPIAVPCVADRRRADRRPEPRLFLIYPEGNFIEAGEDNPSSRSARRNMAG
jgi:putative proteasome-type protease